MTFSENKESLRTRLTENEITHLSKVVRNYLSKTALVSRFSIECDEGIKCKGKACPCPCGNESERAGTSPALTVFMYQSHSRVNRNNNHTLRRKSLPPCCIRVGRLATFFSQIEFCYGTF